jgi:hypothetical protein
LGFGTKAIFDLFETLLVNNKYLDSIYIPLFPSDSGFCLSENGSSRRKRKTRSASSTIFIVKPMKKVTPPKDPLREKKNELIDEPKKNPEESLREKINQAIRFEIEKKNENLSEEKEDEREILDRNETLSMLEKEGEDEAVNEESAMIEIGSTTYKELLSLLEEKFDVRPKFFWKNEKLFITFETGEPHGRAAGEFTAQIALLMHALVTVRADK